MLRPLSNRTQRVSVSIQTDNKATENKSLFLFSILIEYLIALIVCKVLTNHKDGPGVEYLSLLLQSIQSSGKPAGGGGVEEVMLWQWQKW